MDVAAGIVEVGDVEFHHLVGFLRCGPHVARLGPVQADFLEVLRRHAGRLVRNEALIEAVYGHRTDGGPTEDVSRSHIRQLRESLRRIGSTVDIERVHDRGVILHSVQAEPTRRELIEALRAAVKAMRKAGLPEAEAAAAVLQRAE